MKLPPYISYEEYKELPKEVQEEIKKRVVHVVRCPVCKRVYFQLDPGRAIYCNHCGTLFEVDYVVGTRILSRDSDEGGGW